MKSFIIVTFSRKNTFLDFRHALTYLHKKRRVLRKKISSSELFFSGRSEKFHNRHFFSKKTRFFLDFRHSFTYLYEKRPRSEKKILNFRIFFFDLFLKNFTMFTFSRETAFFPIFRHSFTYLHNKKHVLRRKTQVRNIQQLTPLGICAPTIFPLL